MGSDNRSILFLTLSFICIWVIMDSILGKQYLHIFLSNVFPFYSQKLTKRNQEQPEPVMSEKNAVNNIGNALGKEAFSKWYEKNAERYLGKIQY